MSEINIGFETQADGTVVASLPAPAPSIQTLTVAQLNAKAHLDLLKLRYPHLSFVDGSWIQEKGHPYWSDKIRVKVLCPVCLANKIRTEVERATSDLHTFKGCASCMVGVRKGNKVVRKLMVAQLLEKAMKS